MKLELRKTELECLIGKTVSDVELSEGGEYIRFHFPDEESITFYAYGDCCSRSWIETVDDAASIINRPILATIGLNMPEASLGERGLDEFLQFYQEIIKTEYSQCSIEFRNESNGYYGGELVRVGFSFEHKHPVPSETRFKSLVSGLYSDSPAFEDTEVHISASVESMNELMRNAAVIYGIYSPTVSGSLWVTDAK